MKTYLNIEAIDLIFAVIPPSVVLSVYPALNKLTAQHGK